MHRKLPAQTLQCRVGAPITLGSVIAAMTQVTDSCRVGRECSQLNRPRWSQNHDRPLR